mgnify:CR=1 FL=1
MTRKRYLMTIVVAIIVVSAIIVGSYVYLIPPAKVELRMISEQEESRLTGVTAMILCPSKAGEMGLCNTDERDLHAKYRLVVQPPPPSEVGLRVGCKVLEIERLTSLDNPLFPVVRSWAFETLRTPLMDATSNFTCSYTRTGEGTFELDLALIADPHDEQLIARYLLLVTIGYDEPLLPFGLLSRNANGTDIGDLCLLGYHIGKHPPPGTPESEKTLAEFVSCDEAVLWQRELLNIPPPPRVPYARVDSGLLTGLPTIDGFMDPGEWSDAGKLRLDGYQVGADLYAKNDNDFMYVAVDVTPSQLGATSKRFEVRLFFDVDHDSAWVAGRDVVYVYSSNPSYSGFIRYSDECRSNFLFLDGDYSELSACIRPLNDPGAMQGRYYDGWPAGQWVVEMKIPLRGEGGIMTEPRQIVGMEVGIWGGADSHKDPGFYGRWPAQMIEVTLASRVGTGGGPSSTVQSSLPPPSYTCSWTSPSALTEEQVACLADSVAERVDLCVFPLSVRSLIAVRGHGATVHRGA